ncbi:MAG: hypothetical protein IPL49_18000 [Saprospirales bacterium]|nr:hypothetical protein [Saprospirales bacterium]
MKKCSLILLLLSFVLTAFAQAPQSFQYQSIVRNAGGEIIPNQTVGMQISLRQRHSCGCDRVPGNPYAHL